MNEIRQAFNMESQKLQNAMITPFGENQGRRGGTIIIVLLNKFTMGEDDKPQYENFAVSTTPVSNKVFQ